MKNIYAFLAVAACLFFSFAASAQPNFSEHIAPIIYGNCTGCHRPGNIGPFPLQTYDDVTAYSGSIRVAVANGVMPPWPPDSSFQRYAHERLLTQQEKDDLIGWIDNGMPRGDSTLAPPLPNFPTGSELGTPDLQVKAPAYTSQAASTDEYKCFYLPTNLTTDRKVKAIEILPGNREIVHHVLVYAGDANSAPADSACKTQGLKLMTGYTPGATPTIFPNGVVFKTGMTLPAGAVIVLQIHYPTGTAGQVDQTAVNFFFYPENETGVREVAADAILQNWSLFIPANTTKDYTAQYPSGTSVLPSDFSLLSVFPHMHLIGTTIDAYALDPQADTIPFVRIPRWDFEWQGFYNFRKIVKLPAGSKMYARAHYDNTVNNPFNPSSPPKLVIAGEATTDEMMLVYFHYLPYQAGDENLDLDSLLNPPTGWPEIKNNRAGSMYVYPNPATGSVRIRLPEDAAGDGKLEIFNVEGVLVRSWPLAVQTAGTQVVWDARDETGTPLPSGVYFARFRSPGRTATARITLLHAR